ncbi:MAG: hypothetical protein B5M54_09735 [Candidatus Aminicenantes bacterium 4484_214]|nr:MAG: hypothetical protein B5M54_09735 [Candidatus Aminicenantes bacterium 4484_214]
MITFWRESCLRLLWGGVIILLISPGLFSRQQTLVETSLVVNVEVPVRVFDNQGHFVDNLTIDDFEVYEDGVRQKIDAVYLIKKNLIRRKEEKKKLKPETKRTFFLIFEISEYTPRIARAIDDFIEKVLLPEDQLIVVTPQKTYRLKEISVKVKKRKEIANELKARLRRDANMGAADYRSALRDLQTLAAKITSALATDNQQAGPADSNIPLNLGDMEVLINQYMSYLQKLEVLRRVDELRLMDFARYLKTLEGQKYVFLLYQREFIPQIEEKVWIQAASLYQNEEGIDLRHFIADIMELYKRDVSVDVEKIKRAFADASTSIHFLYLTEPKKHIPGVTFVERTGDIFAPFVEMARASGGFYDSSYNPQFLFRKALQAAENYYLLYYTPKTPIGEGKFRHIKVKVKRPGVRIIHRLGYYAY